MPMSYSWYFYPLVHRFEEEQRELEKRKRRALEEYHQKKKLNSSASSLDNSSPLPTSRKSSTDSHDIPLTQSPNQSRRGAPVVDLENYQEAGRIGTVSLSSSSGRELPPSLPPLKRDPAADMEKKVRDELMAEFDHGHNQQEPPTTTSDMALSTRNFSSPPGIRSPRHLTSSVQDLHAKTTSHVHGSSSSKAYHHHPPQQQQASHLHHHHHRGAEGSPLSPPLPLSSSQSPVPRSPTLPTATFMLATSPPPVSQQTIWMSRSQPHPQARHHNIQHQYQQNTTGVPATTLSQGIYHSDSGEWTEFASAPYGEGGQDSMLHVTLPSDGFTASHSTPALCTLTGGSGSGGLLAGGHTHHQHHHQQQLGSSQQKVGGADVSEFDPIAAVSSSGGPMPSSELQQPQQHRT